MFTFDVSLNIPFGFSFEITTLIGTFASVVARALNAMFDLEVKGKVLIVVKNKITNVALDPFPLVNQFPVLLQFPPSL